MKTPLDIMFEMLLSPRVNILVWISLLVMAGYGHFNQTNWFKSYLVYLQIYFLMQAPILVPLFIDGVVKKVLPFVRGGSEALPWLLFITYPTGIIAMLAWSLYLVVKK
ncbi:MULTISPECIES: hypothetical protein [unclassified Vibrio]|uniref:hypothetical protein n=1 Tax=unclassified Vibrio TaxID=2614977 RepID=UPI002074AF23|nr:MULTISPECIES: hypothetical protein [unclassified Vibrio]MDK9778736.1 hypothetical protein [Vibrio sp. D401a]MDK9808691.1 hypothetical protein [Vibrio sp. D406a]USD53032.1 hypothetical protein J4N37_19475 [Vibrio sp. SCSIO 43153]